MATKVISVKAAPIPKIKYFIWAEMPISDTDIDRYNLKHPLKYDLFISVESPYSEQGAKVYQPVDIEGRVKAPFYSFLIPDHLIKKAKEADLLVIKRKLNWFNMYRELSIKEHPFTGIFK